MRTFLQVLAEDERAQVHERTLKVMARTGVRVDTAQGRQILRPDQHQQPVIGLDPPDQVPRALQLLEGSVKQVEVLSGLKDPQAVFKAQSDYAAAVSDQMMASAKKTAEILTETKSELTDWVEAGVKAASDTPLAKAVAAATKKAA